MDRLQDLWANSDTGLDSTRKTGRGGQFGYGAQSQVASERTDHLFVDSSLEIRVADRMKLGGFEPGPIFPKVVEIRARKNLRVAVARDTAIEIGLAEEAAVNRIGQIAFVGKFSRVHNSQPPTLVRCEPFHALGCLFRHGRRDGMESFEHENLPRDGQKSPG